MAIKIIRPNSGSARVKARLGQTTYTTTLEMPENQGFYASRSVQPGAKGTDIVRWLARKCGVDIMLPDDDPFHVTVVASPKEFPRNALLVRDKRECEVLFAGFDSWKGHNDKGYVVMRVTSRYLSNRNAQMRKAGCVPNFQDYNPHITMQVGNLLDPSDFEQANELASIVLPEFAERFGAIRLDGETFNVFD